MFHQPVQSVATYRLALSFQTGASTDSRILPLSRRDLPGTPSWTAATRSSVPSQGMCGWFQEIQASVRPSGDGVGNAKKSGPETRVRIAVRSAAAEPSSGTATIERVTASPSWRSCTHQISVSPVASTKSA